MEPLKDINWEGHYIADSDKQDIVRAHFVLKGWKRDHNGNLYKGDSRLIFVFDEVRLKQIKGSSWAVTKKCKLESLYQKVK